ncbi:unnamed protein product [Bursaphelenchus okinawaensis]|uniref:Transmembrane protein n=1 Tax=Bursaphelenchus okinawaensis TaxID=465554 RepID=A0A811JPU3_9BILA|nr:unnamed protein product [Bursaphelenchus okinawaensis]CAG9077004.1 unnamed protein product [Bursaphelenchus okinawaensis]
MVVLDGIKYIHSQHHSDDWTYTYANPTLPLVACGVWAVIVMITTILTTMIRMGRFDQQILNSKHFQKMFNMIDFTAMEKEVDGEWLEELLPLDNKVTKIQMPASPGATPTKKPGK